MAKKWSEVIQSPAFQALPDNEKEEARNQYFDTVVAPQLPDQNEVSAAREQFDQMYGSKAAPKAVRTSPQDLQARMNAGDAAAGEEFKARYKATTGEDYAPQTGVNPQAFPKYGTQESNATDAFGSTFGDTLNGLMQQQIEGGPARQMVEGAFNMAGVKVPITQTEQGARDWINKRIAEKRALDSPMLAADGGTSGAVTGNVAQMLGPGAIAKASAIKFPAMTNVASALAPTTYRGNAALGGVMGSVQPRVDGESQAANTAFGSLFGLGGRAVGDVIRSPFVAGRYMLDKLSKGGGEASVASDLVEMGVSKTPAIRQAPLDFDLNSAQATGDPVLAALTRARRGRPEFMKELTERLGINQNKADDILETLAGSPEDLAKAQAARSKTTGPLYTEAGKYEGVNTAGVLRATERGAKRLEGAPTAQDKMGQAGKLLTRQIPENVRLNESKAALKTWIDSGARRSSEDTALMTEAHRIINMRNQTPEQALEALKKIKPNSVAAQDALKEAIKTLKTSAKPEDRAFVLDNVRKTLRDMIKGGGVNDSEADKAALRNLVPIKTRLEESMKKQIPEFAEAQKKYAEASGPVNQLQVLQAITGRSKDSMGKVTLGKLDSALRGDKALVKSQTGLKNKTLSDILTPDQKQKLFGVRDYLRIAREAETIGGGMNSQTGQNISLLENMSQKQASIWLNKVPLLKTIGEALDAQSKKVYENALDKALQNPQGLTDVLNKLPPKERARAFQVLGIVPKTTGLIGAAASGQN